MGTIIGSATVANGGDAGARPTSGVGNLTFGNDLIVNNGSTLQYGLGTNSDRAVVSGNLTLGGTLNVSDAGGFGVGTYTLFTYTGGLNITA